VITLEELGVAGEQFGIARGLAERLDEELARGDGVAGFFRFMGPVQRVAGGDGKTGKKKEKDRAQCHGALAFVSTR